MSTNSMKMVLAINVPAFCTVDVPDDVAETEEALRAFAVAQFGNWFNGDGEILFEAEWGLAIPETERVVDVSVRDEMGAVVRQISNGIELDPPPSSFEPVACAEAACRAGLVVEGYLLASVAHLTPAERASLSTGKSSCPHVVISATCAYGVLLHINEKLFEYGADVEAALVSLSEGFASVIKKAIAYSLPFVRFDEDGPAIEGVPTYEDERVSERESATAEAPSVEAPSFGPEVKANFVQALRDVIQNDYIVEIGSDDKADFEEAMANAIQDAAALLGIKAPEDHPNPAEYDAQFYEWSALAGFAFLGEAD